MDAGLIFTLTLDRRLSHTHAVNAITQDLHRARDRIFFSLPHKFRGIHLKHQVHATPQVKAKAAERCREVGGKALTFLENKFDTKGRDMDPKTALDVAIKLHQLAEALEGSGQGPQADGGVSVHVQLAE